jgi:hypothetical protein
MNLHFALRSSALLAGVALFAACATSPLSRIDANRPLYESWPFEIQQAVLNGQVKQGMTPQMVQMSVGRPSQVVSRGLDDEVWVYRKSGSSSSLLNGTGISVGTGGVGIGTSANIGGGGGGPSGEENEVVFQNGVVTRTDF